LHAILANPARRPPPHLHALGNQPSTLGNRPSTAINSTRGSTPHLEAPLGTARAPSQSDTLR
jgi:hypothetical protein